MELPWWFKISNVIKKLDISNYFGNWSFGKKEDHRTFINLNLNIPSTGTPTVEDFSNNGKPKIEEKSRNVEVTEAQSNFITSINEVHRLNGLNYDFKEDYKWALYYIQNKPSEDWQYNAAVRIAQAMQDVDFFGSFAEINDINKKEEFDNLKRKIDYLYNRIIQELRHINKRGQIEKQFKTPYHDRLEKEPSINKFIYEEIFADFQSLLIELFNKFLLKSQP